VGERTFGWFGQSRRLSKESERLCETSEAVIDTAMTRHMLHQLAAA
jgi:transposase